MVRLLTLLPFVFFAVPAQAQTCGMQLGGPPIFCDTFDTKNQGIPSRTGDLDPNVWGVSRTTGQVNFGQNLYNGWAATILQGCTGNVATSPPLDVTICNGQLREASNDNSNGCFDCGVVTVLAMYPKQPFDFAGRTGTVSFDLSNDTHGNHAAWPEFWITNLPIPAPFTFDVGWQSVPQHGVGVRLSSTANPGQIGICPNGNNLNVRRWTIGSAIVVRNYTMDEADALGPSPTGLTVQVTDCVVAPPDGSGITNHIELRISQSQIEVFSTDAGVAPSSSTLRRIGLITNANLSLTRGLVWLEDAHYNADKGEQPSQRQHTFVWDNLAFDGPFTFRDFSYDALDANQPTSFNAINLGKFSDAGQTATWNVLGMPTNPSATAVRVLFNFFTDAPANLNVLVNGNSHPTPWPFPNSQAGWRTFAVTIPITELIAGTNVVQLGADQPMVSSNVNIVLAEVPGGVPVLPGSNNAYPGSGGPVASNGVCGSSNGGTFPTAPTANLCSVGAASPVAGTGPWTWTCAGTNGGADASCSANKTAPAPVNGRCGPANGRRTMTAPMSGLCNAGTPTTVAGTGPWTWSCLGSNGGTDASCQAPVATVCTVVCR